MSLRNLQHILDESKKYIKEGTYLKLSNKIKKLYENKNVKIKYKYIIICNKLAGGQQLIFKNSVSKVIEEEKIMNIKEYKKLVALNRCSCCATIEHISNWFFSVNENTVTYDIGPSGLYYNDEDEEDISSIEYNSLKYILLSWKKCDDSELDIDNESDVDVDVDVDVDNE
jgi:hypothetical protein